MRKQDASGYILIGIICVGFVVMMILTVMFVQAVIRDSMDQRQATAQEQIYERNHDAGIEEL